MVLLGLEIGLATTAGLGVCLPQLHILLSFYYKYPMKIILDFLIYFFCLMFGITRNKKYLVLNNSLIKTKVKAENVGTIIKTNSDYYRIEYIVYDIINKTLTYEYIYIEKIVEPKINKK